MFLANAIIIRHHPPLMHHLLKRSVRFGNVLTKTSCRNINFNSFHVNPFYRRLYNNNTKSISLLKSKNCLLFVTKRFVSSTAKKFNKNVKITAIQENSQKSSDWRRLLSLAKREKWIMLAAVGCLIVSSSITMSVPFAIGKMLDLITDNNFSRETIFNFCTILCGIFVIGAVANFGRVYLINGATLRIVQDLRSKLYRRMINQEVGWFDTKGTGELINRLSNDTYIIGNSLSQNLSDGLRSTVTILAGTSIMFYTSPELTALSLGVLPPIAGLAIIYGRFVKKITKELLDKYAEIMKIGEERLSNIKTVKMFSKELHEHQLFSQHLMDALKIGYRDVLARATFYGMSGFSGNIIIISVLYYGGTLVANNEITIGALTSFILYAGYTALSIGGLSNFYTELNKGVGAASRIWEIFDRDYMIPIHGGLTPMKKPNGEIIFENVSFHFPTRPTSSIICNMNFRIKPGSVTSIVGRSGSGKTTIATLLLRLYDPITGCVYLDGKNLKELNLEWLRSHIGAVNQEPILFSGTIRENILYGLNANETCSENQFQEICKQAHVDHFVQQLPNGYETLVGQRGVLLSGGQKQRVAIARALIRNPSILILDEATSALDSVSESLVQEALANLSHGRTVLTIAHRLSTIRNSDSIIVLNNGQIAEQGNYNELISIDNGVFRDLVKNQTFEMAATVEAL